MLITDCFSFAYHMLRPRTLKWCLRMDSFDRINYSFDYLMLSHAATRERLSASLANKPNKS